MVHRSSLLGKAFLDNCVTLPDGSHQPECSIGNIITIYDGWYNSLQQICNVFILTTKNYDIILGRVDFDMFCEIPLVRVSFAALVALERPFPSVQLHVTLQMTRRSASVVALVTLVWLFTCMRPHHVIFQITSCDAGIFAHCASVRLFPRVGPFVLFQTN